ncbi:MAG: hypothetical protein JWN75_660 [Candidatus Saccharibacteria bacterium]|nr:hypothetical protein [Candidatus Saccharibacteria bacterium]
MPPVSAKRVPWYRHRWFKLSALALGIIVVIAVIAAVILYTLWQSRPEKVFLDTANYALNTPATYKVTTAGTDIAVGVNNQQVVANGTFNNIPISAVFSENTLYIKSPQPEKLYDMYFAQSVPRAFEKTVTTMIANLKNHWISIDLYKMSSLNGTVGTARCGLQMGSQLTSSDVPRTQIGLLYATNPFMNAKATDITPIQSTYHVSIDQTKLKAFYAELTKLDAFKDQSCTQTSNSFIANDLTGSSADLVITRPDHHLKSATIHGSLSTTNIQVDYSKIPAITVPTDAITYDQIAGSILRSLLPAFLGAQ